MSEQAIPTTDGPVTLDASTVNKLLSAASQLSRLESLLTKFEQQQLHQQHNQQQSTNAAVANAGSTASLNQTNQSQWPEKVSVLPPRSPANSSTLLSDRRSSVLQQQQQQQQQQQSSERELLNRIAALEEQNQKLQRQLQQQQHQHSRPPHSTTITQLIATPVSSASATIRSNANGTSSANHSADESSSGSNTPSNHTSPVWSYQETPVATTLPSLSLPTNGTSSSSSSSSTAITTAAAHVPSSSVDSDDSLPALAHSSSGVVAPTSLFAKRSTRSASIEIQLFEQHLAASARQHATTNAPARQQAIEEEQASTNGSPSTTATSSSAPTPSSSSSSSSSSALTVPKKASFRLLRADSRQCEYSTVGNGRISLGVRSTNLVRLNWAPPTPSSSPSSSSSIPSSLSLPDKFGPQNVLVIKKPGDVDVSRALYDIALWLAAHGKTVYVEPNVQREETASINQLSFLQTWHSPQQQSQLHLLIDLVICLGGDGTLLWASNLFKTSVPPVISFALGSLGFLSPFPLEHFSDSLLKVFKGGFHLTLRSRLVCTIVKGNRTTTSGSGTATAGGMTTTTLEKGHANSNSSGNSGASPFAGSNSSGNTTSSLAKTTAHHAARPSLVNNSHSSSSSSSSYDPHAAAPTRTVSDPLSSLSSVTHTSDALPASIPTSSEAPVEYAEDESTDSLSDPSSLPVTRGPSLSVVKARHYSLSAQGLNTVNGLPHYRATLPVQITTPDGQVHRRGGSATFDSGPASPATDTTIQPTSSGAPNPSAHIRAHARFGGGQSVGIDAVPDNEPSSALSPDDMDAYEADDVESYVCMNEVILDRGLSAYLTLLDCYVDGMLFTRVQADGIIVGTPTGSTAYSLSAGGSMCHPEVPCFPVSDTRILTDHGFLYYDEVLTLLDNGEVVLYACYEENTQQLVYTPGTLIRSYESTSLLEFTQDGESSNWSDKSGPYGTLWQEESDDDRSNHLSIRVTPNHIMYVQLGNQRSKRVQGIPVLTWSKHQNDLLPPQRIRAADLILEEVDDSNSASVSTGEDDNGSEEVEADVEDDEDDNEELDESLLLSDSSDNDTPVAHQSTKKRKLQSDGVTSKNNSHVRFLAYAANGIGSPDTSLQLITWFNTQLGLQTQQVNTFLQLFGFWLGGGGTDCSNERITFNQNKSSDRIWLNTILPTLLPAHQWNSYKVNERRERFYIMAPLWWRFFNQHCGIVDDDEVDQGITSVKYFPPWVYQCGKDQLRMIIQGLRCADDGVWNDGMEATASISTSGIKFRDTLMHILMRAGYTAFFKLGTVAGTVKGYKSITNGGEVIACKDYEQLGAEEKVLYDPIIARHDEWIVNWSDPLLGGPATLASTSGHPHMSRSSIRSLPGEPVWCVQVDHKDNLLVVQRAMRVEGRVTKAARPIIIGNCMLFTPVCPHSLSFRPLLFPDTSTLQIKVSPDSRGANCASFDGRHRAALEPGDSLLISMSRWPLPSICRMDGTTDWFDGVRSVLQWNSRSASQKSFHATTTAAAGGATSAANVTPSGTHAAAAAAAASALNSTSAHPNARRGSIHGSTHTSTPYASSTTSAAHSHASSSSSSTLDVPGPNSPHSLSAPPVNEEST